MTSVSASEFQNTIDAYVNATNELLPIVEQICDSCEAFKNDGANYESLKEKIPPKDFGIDTVFDLLCKEYGLRDVKQKLDGIEEKIQLLGDNLERIAYGNLQDLLMGDNINMTVECEPHWGSLISRSIEKQYENNEDDEMYYEACRYIVNELNSIKAPHIKSHTNIDYATSRGVIESDVRLSAEYVELVRDKLSELESNLGKHGIFSGLREATNFYTMIAGEVYNAVINDKEIRDGFVIRSILSMRGDETTLRVMDELSYGLYERPNELLKQYYDYVWDVVVPDVENLTFLYGYLD